MATGFGTLVSTIDGVKNYHSIWSGYIESNEIKEYIADLKKIAYTVRGLGELEGILRKEFGTEILEVDGYRIANAIGVAGTQIRRYAESIILSKGETAMPTKTNLGGSVIDPIGWSSKVIAPSEGYGIMGKISALRPTSPDFDEELHEKTMKQKINLDFRGIAYEIGDKEKALMPIFKIKGIDDLITPFSQEIQKGDFSTAKHYGVNL